MQVSQQLGLGGRGRQTEKWWDHVAREGEYHTALGSWACSRGLSGQGNGCRKGSNLSASRSAGLMKESGEVADNSSSQDPMPSSDLILFLINSGSPQC